MIPVYFTNGEEATIQNNSEDLLNQAGGNGEDSVYKIDLNVPLVDATNNPPYTGNIFTVFPWFLGGYEKGYSYIDVYTNSNTTDDSENEVSGYGIISMPVFAHIF